MEFCVRIGVEIPLTVTSARMRSVEPTESFPASVSAVAPVSCTAHSSRALLFHIFEIIKADVLYHSRKLTALCFQRTVHVRNFNTALVITLYLRVKDTPKNKHDNFLILSHFSYLLSVRILDKVYKPRGLDNIVCYKISQTMYALAFFFKF